MAVLGLLLVSVVALGVVVAAEPGDYLSKDAAILLGAMQSPFGEVAGQPYFAMEYVQGEEFKADRERVRRDAAERLKNIRERGYSIDEQEQELGVRCFAMAVPNAPTPTAISVSGPISRVDEGFADKAIPLLRSAAQARSRQTFSTCAYSNSTGVGRPKMDTATLSRARSSSTSSSRSWTTDLPSTATTSRAS